MTDFFVETASTSRKLPEKTADGMKNASLWESILFEWSYNFTVKWQLRVAVY